MPLSGDGADALDADVLHHLGMCFPGWLRLVRTCRDEAGRSYIEVTVPPPEGIRHERPLEISTWGQEVTVSFGDHHTHFPWPEGYDGSDNRGRVMDYLRAIIDERIVVRSVWAGGRMKLSSMACPEGLSGYTPVQAGDHELRVTSWRGTHDRRFPVDWQSYLKASYS